MSYFAPATIAGGSYFAPLEAPATGGAVITLGDVLLVAVGVVSDIPPATGGAVIILGAVTLSASGTVVGVPPVTGGAVITLGAVTLIARGGSVPPFERSECRTYDIDPENRTLTIGVC